MTPDEFEQLVAEAVDSLPPFFLEKMQNVEILVMERPTADMLHRTGTRQGHLLLGLYEGVPLTRRTSGYNLITPDVIWIFQRPLQQVAGTDLDILRERIRHTVIHEIAHHFGISDERLIELGAY
ncbi:MAG: metallopeptidase family protein [Ardenticatenaceae bacterium]|nr:metallopeptidase family protein [Ardenticatenaceae bacterium]